MKRYGAIYSSLVLCLFILACASCRPLLSSITRTSCSEASSSPTIDSPPAGWARYSPAGLNLSIALPGEPHPRQIPLPEDVQRSASRISSYTYNDQQMFVFLTCNSLKAGTVSSKGLKEYTEGFINGYKKSATDMNNLRLTAEPDTPCRMSLKGSYRKDNRDVELEGFSQAKDANLWIVFFSHAQNNAESKASVKSAQESVRLD